jgi:hypothetical protein
MKESNDPRGEHDVVKGSDLSLGGAEEMTAPDFESTKLAGLLGGDDDAPGKCRKRLRTPVERALIASTVGLAAGAVLLATTSVRADLQVVSRGITWIPGALELLSGLLAIFLAMRWSIPGEGETRVRSWGLAGLVVALATGFALLAPHLVVDTHPGLGVGPCVKAGMGCVLWQLGAGLPVMGLSLWLITRAAPTASRMSGALAGLGAGLIADAAMHFHCAAVDPIHTILYHLLPVGLLTALAAMLAGRFARW